MLLRLYKKYLSPENFGIHTCIFDPSCSVYTYQAVEKYGVIKGIGLGTKRILKCNPWHPGGFDPVR